MDQVQFVLQAIYAAAIVPFVDYLKTRFIPPDLAFVTWLMTAVLAFLGALGINALLAAGLSIQELINIALAIMAVSGGVHAGAKMRSKKRAKG